MRLFVVLLIIFFFNFTNAFANSLNDTFQVNKQSEGYLLGWNLSWAENCNQYGYYNKFWKLYKKLLATNNPKFEGIKQGWTRASQADESTNCSENVLKQLLINTENLLNSNEVKETKNSQETSVKSQNTKNLIWCAQSWMSDKDSLWHFPYWVKKKNQCTYNIISEEEAINEIKKSAAFTERLCDFVSGNMTEHLKPYFDLVDKYNFNCTEFNNSKSNPNINANKITSKTKNAEDKCTEIGFTKGTEKYGDCVLKMLELK